MKPLKGMNQDITSANMPEGMYRKAQNFIYGKELDSLMQEPGFRTLVRSNTNFAVMGVVPLKNNHFLLFTYKKGNSEGLESSIRRYNAFSETLESVVSDDGYKFFPWGILSAVTFFNESNEEHVVFTDDINPIRIINIDNPQTDLTLNKLFAEHDAVRISGNPSTTPGGFKESSNFFCVAFEHVDGSVTGFQSMQGPFMAPPEGAVSFDLSITGIDTDYTHIQLGCISIVNGAYITKVLTRLPVISSVINLNVDNLSSYREISLEGLVGQSVRYSTARTLTFHENRLYLGNLTQAPEDNLQKFANRIQPMWVYGNISSGGFPHNWYDEGSKYPDDMVFMPDEVYAFYVEYTRLDGSLTQAYHIPGEPPRTIKVPVDTILNPESATEEIQTFWADESFSSDGKISDLIGFDDNFHSDTRIQGADAKYFRTRSATMYDGDFVVTTDDNLRGRMAYWENEEEVYESTFPVQQRFTTYPTGPGNEPALEASNVVLAGKKVRHHKFPSMQFFASQSGTGGLLPDTFCNGADPSTPTIIDKKAITIEFDHVIIPEGYQSVRFFYAKRIESNTTILGQGPVHYGHKNTYAQHSVADVDGAYENFTSSVGLNSSSLNSLDYADVDQYMYPYLEGDSSLDVSHGRMHADDLLTVKPFIAKNSGAHYLKNEYMVTTETSYPSTAFQEWIFESGYGFDQYINIMWENDSFEGRERRNRLMLFDNINNSVITKGRTYNAVQSIKSAHYLAPGIIDSEFEIDNRAGEESVAFEIEHEYTGSPSANSYKGIGKPRALHDIVMTPHTSNGGYGKGANGFKFRKLVSGLDSTGTTGETNTPNVSVVQSHHIANFCAFRKNVCVPYATQELVVCSRTIRVSDLAASAVTTSDQSDPVVLQDLITSVHGSSGRVGFNNTYGDVVFTKSEFRNTAQVGWGEFDLTFGLSSTGVYGQYLVNTFNYYASEAYETGVTLSNDVGSLRVMHKDAVFGRVDYFLKNIEQLKITDYLRLGGPDNTTDPAYSNDYTYNKDFLHLNTFAGKSIHTELNEGEESLPFRVARSAAMSVDTDKLNIRYFPALDTYEQTRERGEIVNLQSFNDKILIHHELGLFVTRGKEKLSTTSGQITFGDGDVFATKPVEVIPTPDGYAGTQHQLSCLLTPSGYFFADESQGKLFRYSDKLDNIGAAGLNEFLRTDLRVRKDLKSIEAFFGFYPGIVTTYDPKYERVLFQLRNFTDDEDLSIPISTGGHATPLNDGTGYFDTPGRTVNDFTLSYSMRRNTWTSFHTYESTALCGTRDSLYSIDVPSYTGSGGPQGDGQPPEAHPSIYLHGSEDSFVGKFVPTSDSRSYIDVAFPFGQGAILSDFNWYTKVVDERTGSLSHKEHDVTFTHAMVSNDYQCSGNISLTRTSAGFNGGPDISGNMRRADYKWFFNQFRDLVDNRTLSFIDESGAAINTNIDTEKPWNEQKRFVGNFANVRLTLANTMDTTNILYLYDVDAKVRKSYR